jgi:hypothetical protein
MAGMERATMDRIQHELEEEVKKRFPGAVLRVALLQYGDDPVIEPGELMVRVFVEVTGDREEKQEAFHAFGEANRQVIKQFRKDLSDKLPEAARLEFRIGGEDGEGGEGPRMMLGGRPRGLLEARALEGKDLTPVMARLGPADLETLDALITAGIASSRAEAVRWALARIRERPAYNELRERAREIERLKTEF